MSKPLAAVRDYIDALPDERREAVEAIRAVIDRHLPEGYEAGMQYGMPAWFVPHAVFPEGYHCDPDQPVPFVSVANQKKHIGLYLFCIYLDADVQGWFETEWRKTGKRWDAGKSCVRVKTLDDIPLPLIGKLIERMTLKRFLANYRATRPVKKVKTTKQVTGKTAKRSATSKKAATKRFASRKKTAVRKK